VRAHLLPAFRGRRIEKITPDDIEQWRDELLDERGASRRKALEKAKLRPLRFHDLRHTFGSIAINQATIVQSRRGWATPTCRPR
jgi:integrase